LSAAYHLGEDALLIERNAEVGGWCRSIELDGFTFDFAGHIMFSNDPYVHEMYEMLLGDNVHWQDREAWVYSKNVYTRYPFQGALYGLPPQVIKECLAGAIECRFGTLSPSTQEKSSAVPRNSESSHINGKQQSGKNGHDQNSKRSGNGTTECSAVRLLPAGDEIDDCCGDGILESTTPLAKEVPSQPAPNTPANFEEFIYKVWGRGIAKHFAIPYNRKLWAVPLNEMETSWLGGRVPLPDLEEMIEGALSPVPKPMGPNARFGYPLRGGFQSLMSGFLPHLKGPLRLQTEITGFAPSRHEVTLSTGEVLNYQHLISTMPLPVLIRLAGDEAPPEIQDAAKGLRYISVRCVHLGIGRENLTDKHWIYYPEDSVFHRIFVQGNASPYCNPAGGFGLTCEITYDSQHKPLPCDGDDLIQLCIDDCRRVGIISSDDPVLTATQVDLPHAYVIYDHQRAQRVALIRNWLISQDVILAGRYSEWEYYNSDHAFLAGKKAADKVQARLALMKRQELSTK
jgi:UDP-galactopyranose mutase